MKFDIKAEFELTPESLGEALAAQDSEVQGEFFSAFLGRLCDGHSHPRDLQLLHIRDELSAEERLMMATIGDAW